MASNDKATFKLKAVTDLEINLVCQETGKLIVSLGRLRWCQPILSAWLELEEGTDEAFIQVLEASGAIVTISLDDITLDDLQ